MVSCTTSPANRSQKKSLWKSLLAPAVSPVQLQPLAFLWNHSKGSVASPRQHNITTHPAPCKKAPPKDPTRPEMRTGRTPPGEHGDAEVAHPGQAGACSMAKSRVPVVYKGTAWQTDWPLQERLSRSGPCSWMCPGPSRSLRQRPAEGQVVPLDI